MKPSDDLFQLIHSLTPAEKRYFRMFTKLREEKEDKHYLELFDLLHSMPEFDAEALANKWGAARIHRLAADKHYLYDQILKAMRLLYAESNLRNRSQGAIQDGIFLYNKTLFAQSRKMMDKARKLAAKVEYYGALVEIMQQERLLIKRLRTTNRKAWLEKAISENGSTMKQLIHLLHSHDVYDRVFWAAQEDLMPNASEYLLEVAAVLEEMQSPADTHAKSFRATHLMMQTQASYQRLMHNSHAALDWTRKLIQHWDGNPDMIEEETFKYKIILCNYLGFCCNAGEFADFETVLQRIHSFKVGSSHEAFEIYQNTHYFNLLYILNTGKFSQGAAILPEMEAWFQKARASLNIGRELSFRYNIAVLCFFLEDTKKALYWVNDILNEGRAEVRVDIQRFARIMQLVLHYERGNWETFDVLLRSARRYLKQNARESLAELALMDLLKKLRDVPEGSAATMAFSEFKTALTGIDQSATTMLPLELHIWVEAKVHNIPLTKAAANLKEILQPSGVQTMGE